MTADPRAELIAAATSFYSRGWMVGTAGNLSARLHDGSFWITVSGKDKGELEPTDFIRVDPDGQTIEKFHAEDRPSAETCIHATLYRLFPEAGACFHVHSVPANLVSNLFDTRDIRLPPLEMIKGLDIWEEEPKVDLPLFPNHLDVPRVAQAIEERFAASPPNVPALLVQRHGVTAWANTVKQARNRIEVLEFIFQYMVEFERVQGGAAR